MMDPRTAQPGEPVQIVEELCSFEGRLAGTDAERRAAGRMAQRLRELGRRVQVEPIHVHPQAALVHAAHCLAGFAGSLVAVVEPAAGFAIVLAAATSMYLDLNGRVYLLRRLFFRRASQNVVSPGGRPDAAATLVVTAHVDAARTGAAFKPARVARAARLARLLPFPFGPYRLLFWSLAALLPLLGLRMAGVDADAISLGQLLPTLVLLVGVFALVDIELSPVVPGANDNASGVALALALARALRDEPPHSLDVWVVITGGEECLMEGMRSFVRSRRGELERATTLFLNLDSLGGGQLRYVTSQGLAVSFEMDPRMAELCEAIADAGHESDDAGSPRPAALRHGFADDALPARLAGYRAISLTALEPGSAVPPGYHRMDDVPERLDPAALERARSFALTLVAALDRDARRAGAHPEPVAQPTGVAGAG